MLTRVEQHYPSASQCGECHIEIYKEWTESLHSKSYSSDSFRLATNDHSFEDCLGCHTPVSIHAAGVPAARNAIREEGVTCISCHFNQGTLIGPIEPTATVVPHEVGVEKEFFTTSSLCGTCHQGTYEEWRNAAIENKKNCQDCHMPKVKRKVTQADSLTSKILVSMEEEHMLRRHTFSFEKMEAPEEAVSLDVRWECEEQGGFAEVNVINLLPHFIPTGDFGFRKATLSLTVKSDDGKTLLEQAVDIYKETQTALRPLERRAFRFSLPLEASRLEIVLKREGQDGAHRFIIDQHLFVKGETNW